MTALTTQRMTGLSKTIKTLNALLAADAKIFKGAVCGFKGGYLYQWSPDAGLQHPCIAIPETSTVVDNTGGGDGDLSCAVEFIREKTCYLLANDTVSPITQANIGGNAYGLDDQTASASDDSAARARLGTPWIVQGTNSMGYRLGVYIEFDAADPTADVLALLASTASGSGADLIAAFDTGGIYTEATVRGQLQEVKGVADDALALAQAAPAMQAVNATLSSGTITISTGITVAANSEVIPLLIGPITGSTNFASLEELKASRVNGAPGVGTVVIEALGNNGALDADAAGAIRVVILTPQV